MRGLMEMRKVFPISLLFLPFLATNLFSSIINTSHNLSCTSNAIIRAVDETEICKFCHVPHGAQVSSTTVYSYYNTIYGQGNYNFRLPLISHQLTVEDNRNRAYADYTSTWTLPDVSGSGWDYEDKVWPPSGVSKVCFSCHDATLQVGQLTTGVKIDMDNATAGDKLDADDRLTMYSIGYLGKEPNPRWGSPTSYFPGWHELSAPGPHIFSTRVTNEVVTDSNNVLKSVSAMQQGLWGYRGIDRTDFVQCNSCHDPHSENIATNPDGSPFGGLYKFWNVGGDDSYRKVCAVCHFGHGY